MPTRLCAKSIFYILTSNSKLLTVKTIHVIGIDLGGTKITGALFTLDGDILLRKHQYLGKNKGKQVAELIIRMLHEFMSLGHSIKAIGICVPGIVNKNTGEVWAPNIPDWDNYPLLDEINNSISNISTIKIHIASDRTCYILGEKWMGQASHTDNAIYFSVGTGIGLGILLDGRIVHGHADIVGAIGWMALQSPFDSTYKDCGCFETYASGNGIANHAKHLLSTSSELYTDSLLYKLNIDRIKSSDVFQAYSMGDRLAQVVIDKAIEFWGMAAANVISLFNPALIIWGGGVFGLAVQFIERIREEAQKWAQPIGGAKFQNVQELENQFTLVRNNRFTVGSSLYSARDILANRIGITNKLAELYAKDVIMPFAGRQVAAVPVVPSNLKLTGNELSWTGSGTNIRFAVYYFSSLSFVGELVGVTTANKLNVTKNGHYAVTALNVDHLESKASNTIEKK